MIKYRISKFRNHNYHRLHDLKTRLLIGLIAIFLLLVFLLFHRTSDTVEQIINDVKINNNDQSIVLAKETSNIFVCCLTNTITVLNPDNISSIRVIQIANLKDEQLRLVLNKMCNQILEEEIK